MTETPPIAVAAAQPKNSGLAICSLVCGILAILLSVVCIGPLFSIPAVICGHMAYGRIRRSAGALSGQGLALGGLITGYTGLALIPLIGLLAAIAIPNFVKARSTAQMNACVSNLRQIDGAKATWAMENKKEASDTPTAHDLDKYLNGFSNMKCPAGGTYQINTVNEKPTCSIPNHQLPGD